MASLSELGEVMHEEHFRMLVLLCGVENRVTGTATAEPIDPDDPDDRALLDEMIAGLDEVIGHNTFEEVVLFPAISGSDETLAGHLRDEHLVIGPLAARLRSLAADTRVHGTSFARWSAFREAAVELASQLIMHLETEEIAIVQRLRSLIDPDVDHALLLRYLDERSGTAEANATEVSAPAGE